MTICYPGCPPILKSDPSSTESWWYMSVFFTPSFLFLCVYFSDTSLRALKCRMNKCRGFIVIKENTEAIHGNRNGDISVCGITQRDTKMRSLAGGVALDFCYIMWGVSRSYNRCFDVHCTDWRYIKQNIFTQKKMCCKCWHKILIQVLYTVTVINICIAEVDNLKSNPIGLKRNQLLFWLCANMHTQLYCKHFKDVGK